MRCPSVYCGIAPVPSFLKPRSEARVTVRRSLLKDNKFVPELSLRQIEVAPHRETPRIHYVQHDRNGIKQGLHARKRESHVRSCKRRALGRIRKSQRFL